WPLTISIASGFRSVDPPILNREQSGLYKQASSDATAAGNTLGALVCRFSEDGVGGIVNNDKGSRAYSIVKNRSDIDHGHNPEWASRRDNEFNIHEMLMRRGRVAAEGISGLIYDKRERSRMPYQLINSVTGQVQRASRLQLTAIHREAAKKKARMRSAAGLGNAGEALAASSFRRSALHKA
ncbi:hypothetical protein BDFB_008025, partial [Asbolus verrucosus]